MRTSFVTIALVCLMIAVPTAAMAQGTQEYRSDDDPGYDGGPVEIQMYHHVYNLLDKVPMNTQQMDPAVPDIDQGFTFPTVEGAPAEVPVSNDNSMYMYNSPGPVHYNTSLKEPKYHPERGLSYDLKISNDGATVYWHMSASATDTLVGDVAPTDVGAMPEVTVRATVRLGDDVGGNLDDGQIVAQGETTTDIMTGLPGQGNGTVTEIAIPLSIQTQTIPKDESFNLKVEWFQAEEPVEFMDRQWKLHSGQEYPNRLVWQVENPIRMTYVHPQPIGDRKIAIHTAFNTPFGNYDVDLDNLKFTMKDSDGNTVTPQSLQGPIVVQKSFVHNHHFEPVLGTWVWNYRADDADPGEYTIEVEATNLQGNAKASKTASFFIQEEGKAKVVSSSGEEVEAVEPQSEEENESPLGFVPMAAAALIAVAVAAHRRRRA